MHKKSGSNHFLNRNTPNRVRAGDQSCSNTSTFFDLSVIKRKCLILSTLTLKCSVSKMLLIRIKHFKSLNNNKRNVLCYYKCIDAHLPFFRLSPPYVTKPPSPQRVKNIFAFKRGNNFNLFHSIRICITPRDKHLHLK